MILEITKQQFRVVKKFWHNVQPNSESKIIRLQNDLLARISQLFCDGLLDNLKDITSEEISDRNERIMIDMEEKVSSCISFETFIVACSEHFGAITLQEVSDFDESKNAE